MGLHRDKAYGCTTVDERDPADPPAAAVAMVPLPVAGMLPLVRGGLAAMTAGEDGVGNGTGQGNVAQETAVQRRGATKAAPIRGGGCLAMNTLRIGGEEKVRKKGDQG